MTHQDHASESVFKDEGVYALSPARFAHALGISETELAEALRVDLDTLQQRPDDASIQQRLRPFVGVFESLLALQSDAALAAVHMMATRINVLDHRTLFDTVRDGDFGNALRYLQTISSGQNG